MKKEMYYCIKSVCFDNDPKQEYPIFIANKCYKKTLFYDGRDNCPNLIAMLYNNGDNIHEFNIQLTEITKNYPDYKKFSDYFTSLKELRKFKLQKILK